MEVQFMRRKYLASSLVPAAEVQLLGEHIPHLNEMISSISAACKKLLPTSWSPFRQRCSVEAFDVGLSNSQSKKGTFVSGTARNVDEIVPGDRYQDITNRKKCYLG
jgi:hypothetical protein